MSHPDLEAAVLSVPFLAPLGVSVESASAGNVVLRVPADKRTRDFSGHVASGALFVVGELAATLAIQSHPALVGQAVHRKHAHIVYHHSTTRALTASASVGVLVEDQDTVQVIAVLRDRDLVVATVTAVFAVSTAL